MAPRVLVAFGSESGGCKKVANTLGNKLRERGVVEQVDVADGNAVAHEIEDLASIKDAYDVLLVITSSFGDGEPPGNFGDLLLRLLVATERGLKPLAGLQHAVLGEGSSMYEATFQNCPRLTDRYLEELGSRRLVPRHETDAVGDEDVAVSRNAFRDAIFKVFDEGLPPADTPPAAEWSKPRASHKEPLTQITLKTAAELSGQNGGQGRLERVGHMVGPAVIITFAIGAVLSYIFEETLKTYGIPA